MAALEADNTQSAQRVLPPRRARRGRGESGESLVELMVAISIMGIAVVSIVSAMAAGILLSTRHRQQTTANTALVAAAEWVKAQPYDTNCPAAYAPPARAGLTPRATVTYLDVGGGTVACSSDIALQQVEITVTDASGYTAKVTVVKRNAA